VSPDYLSSDFILDEELPLLLNASRNHGLTILWIPIRHAFVEKTDICEYQAASDPLTPLEGMSPEEANRTLKNICKLIEQRLKP
jgi:hypothetical protein